MTWFSVKKIVSLDWAEPRQILFKIVICDAVNPTFSEICLQSYQQTLLKVGILGLRIDKANTLKNLTVQQPVFNRVESSVSVCSMRHFC